MKIRRFLLSTVLTVLYTAVSCGWAAVRQWPLICVPVFALALIVNLSAGAPYHTKISTRLKFERHGTECLKIFLASSTISAIYHIWLAVTHWGTDRRLCIVSAIWCVIWLALLFWNGIISVYCTSVQLGVKTRVLGAVFGMIFPINLVMLFIIISKCGKETELESAKQLLDLSRENEQVCRTKYPILLVHGVFFRDNPLLEYWGRIPAELRRNGATVFHGEHQSAASVADSAVELTGRIEQIIRETGCEKVNIIAHSKGGLDCREAIAQGAGKYIASLTTINTPHRGCEFADYLIDVIPESVQKKVESTYNSAAKKLGDKTPDFMAAVKDLTASRCKAFDSSHPLPDGILCRSVGTELTKASGGTFPLNFSYLLVKRFDGPNDGLVGRDSFKWGEDFTYLRSSHRRGISHADIIDLMHEDIRDFDVREFYVQLVSDLKDRGL